MPGVKPGRDGLTPPTPIYASPARTVPMKTFVFPVHALAYERMVEKAEEGVMPRFRELMDRGSYGVCTSVMSTASPVDYTSLLTGTTPQQHGILDFQTGTFEGSLFWNDPAGDPRVIPPEELDSSRLYTADDVDVPWVWDLLPDQRVVQFGIFSPTTFPAPDLPNDGIWLSGFWTKPTSYLRDLPDACNDPDVRDRILDVEPDYPVTPLFAVPPIYPAGCDSERDYLRAVLDNNMEWSERIHAARLPIVQDEEWDILVSEDGICDNTQHLLWPRSPDNPAFDPDVDPWLASEGLLDAFYRHLDDLLADYLAELPDDANVVVVSVHGQEATTANEYMHDQFLNLYKYDIWETPPGWEFRESRPDWSPPTRAHHTDRGAYIVAGPAFADGGESAPISCMDIAPLLLDVYGRDVPAHMDGRVPSHLRA